MKTIRRRIVPNATGVFVINMKMEYELKDGHGRVVAMGKKKKIKDGRLR